MTRQSAHIIRDPIVKAVIDELAKRQKLEVLKKVVTIKEAAEVLSKKRVFIYQLLDQGYLEEVRIGRSRYVTKQSLLKIQEPK